nr:hypothetical protein [Pseudonocardia terrae]
MPEAERLPALLKRSEDSQEDLTDALGVQVRQAVELLVTAIGRADVLAGGNTLTHVSAHDVYRGAVSVMMRIVFLLFAEERRLLPSDNELYATAYSASRLGAELEQRALEGSEDELETSTAVWHRLLALFRAVHDGIEHPRLTLTAHDGSLFDPDDYLWMPKSIDDRTVLHMLRAVQFVEVGKGKNRERRTLSFRQLDVEQIGYVYEGLLSFEGFRASDVVVGLTGKPGLEEEVLLSDLEKIPADSLVATIAEKYTSSGIGSVAALTKKLVPLAADEREEARKKYLAVTNRDYELADPPGRGPTAGPARGPPRLGSPDGRAAARRSTHRPRSHRQGPRPGEGLPRRGDLPELPRPGRPPRSSGRRRDRRAHRAVRLPERSAMLRRPRPGHPTLREERLRRQTPRAQPVSRRRRAPMGVLQSHPERLGPRILRRQDRR